MTAAIMDRGQHPRSRENLSPRTPKYGERKRPHQVGLTDTAWAGLQALAAANGVPVADLLERLGRGQFVLVPRTPPEPPTQPDQASPVDIVEG